MGEGTLESPCPLYLTTGRAYVLPACVWGKLREGMVEHVLRETREGEPAQSPSLGHVHSVVGEDLVCGTCGSRLAHLLIGVDDDDKDSSDATSDAADTRPAPQPQPTARKQPAKVANVKPRRAALKPGITHSKAVRRAVRVEMLAQIPGMNRSKARAVIEALPTGTMGSIMALSRGELGSIPVGSGRLGTDLALALKRVVS